MKIMLDAQDIKKAIANYLNEGHVIQGEFHALPEHVEWHVLVHNEADADDFELQGAFIDLVQAKQEFKRMYPPGPST